MNDSGTAVRAPVAMSPAAVHGTGTQDAIRHLMENLGRPAAGKTFSDAYGNMILFNGLPQQIHPDHAMTAPGMAARAEESLINPLQQALRATQQNVQQNKQRNEAQNLLAAMTGSQFVNDQPISGQSLNEVLIDIQKATQNLAQQSGDFNPEAAADLMHAALTAISGGHGLSGLVQETAVKESLKAEDAQPERKSARPSGRSSGNSPSPSVDL